MTAKRFVDTNILLYAASLDPRDAAKCQQAITILREPELGLSAQVLQEFVANATGKKNLQITEAKIEAVLQALDPLPCYPITAALVHEALRLRSRYQISYWDAAILAAALALGCHTLYSEDLSHGQLYGPVRVVNPFRAPAV